MNNVFCQTGSGGTDNSALLAETALESGFKASNESYREKLLMPQEERPEQKKWRFYGYVKNMQSANVLSSDIILLDNLLHNRLNFRWFPTRRFTAAIEVRNRLFLGDQLMFPGFSDAIDQNNDIVDMSVIAVDKRALVIHSMIDRLYLDYAREKWQLTVGRQRINWGVTLVWNPNDLFNTYSFYDFDYEERPGSDAVRFQYYTGFASGFEIAAKAYKETEDIVAAGMYKWNISGYDFQALGGVYQENIALGGGWAGNIKKAGFKGEFTYFHPYEDLDENEGELSASVGFDYSFNNSLYLNFSGLFNTSGSLEPDVLNLIALDVSPVRLSPYKYSVFAQASYPFTPLLNGSFATIYSPGDDALYLFPYISYSIAENWDVDFLSQLLFIKINGRDFEDIGKLFYLRLKWSF